MLPKKLVLQLIASHRPAHPNAQKRKTGPKAKHYRDPLGGLTVKFETVAHTTNAVWT